MPNTLGPDSKVGSLFSKVSRRKILFKETTNINENNFKIVWGGGAIPLS